MDQEEAKVVGLVSGKEIVLKRTAPANLAIFRAEFGYSIDESFFRGKQFECGEEFSIPGSASRCIVKEIEPGSVKLEIQREDGGKFLVIGVEVLRPSPAVRLAAEHFGVGAQSFQGRFATAFEIALERDVAVVGDVLAFQF